MFHVSLQYKNESLKCILDPEHTFDLVGLCPYDPEIGLNKILLNLFFNEGKKY